MIRALLWQFTLLAAAAAQGAVYSPRALLPHDAHT